MLGYYLNTFRIWENMMARTVFNVADHILISGKNKDKNFDLLQLIKLCYLSYGW